jgi:hypothetical protein
MPFIGELNVVLVNPAEDEWVLNEPLRYLANNGELYIVPAGFPNDMASIPRLPVVWWLFKFADTHRPGVLHDYLIRNTPRKRADAVFFEALRSEGVGWVRAKMMWAAVRLISIFNGGKPPV